MCTDSRVWYTVYEGHPEIVILIYPFRTLGFKQFVMNAPQWLNGQMTCLTVQWVQVQISRVLRKTNQKNSNDPYKKILGVNKISHPRSAVEARRKHRQSFNMSFIKSERLMVIALWAGGRQIETDRGYLSNLPSFEEAGVQAMNIHS